MDLEKEDKYLRSRKIIKAMRANPYPLMLQSYNENNDIIPVLDPIPDGDYVQYYDSYCMLDSKGNCDWITDKVAGYFTIKNNVLHGEATWFGLQGEILKHGVFNSGLKEGLWQINTYDLGWLDEFSAERYIRYGTPDIDTLIEVIEFKNGSKNGIYTSAPANGIANVEGYYKDNDISGEWTYRIGPWEEILLTKEARENRDLTRISETYTLNDDDLLVVKPILIRESNVYFWDSDPDEFNFESLYTLKEIPYNLYQPAFEREVDLDLDEEKGDVRDYSDEYGYEEEYYYEDDYYYDEYGEFGEGDFDSDQAVIFDATDKKYKKRGIVIDSIGAYPNYINTYESYYPNGQLAFKYEFIDGLLKEEPVVYWDNGTIHDEVVYLADSSQYERNTYDYDGKLFRTTRFDTKGDFLKIIREPKVINYIILDSLEVEDYAFSNSWSYRLPDSTYDDVMTEKVLHNRSWSKKDTSVLWEGYYDPINRVRTIASFAVNGDVSHKIEAQFSENFESWTGKSYEYFGTLELETIKSASLLEYVKVDSFPQSNVTEMFNWYDITNDHTLKLNGELYSGILKIDLAQKKMAINDGLEVDLAGYEDNSDKLKKNYEKYKKTGKSKQMLELSRVNASGYANGGSFGTFRSIFQPLLGGFFSYYSSNYYNEYDYEYYDEGKQKRVKKSDMPSRVEVIEGALIDGKPAGKWTSYDQFGKILVTVDFENGEANGKAEYFDYAEPADDYGYYSEFDQDTFPETKTYYLSQEENYVNGRLDGKSTSYDWTGDIVAETEYQEGYRHGKSIERNNLAISISQYERGALDGYVRTYLTLPGRDSLLLYDLLFQNGLLQGESKSYHTNGNISKRGFFLSGEPIEDYEGFDSLGFRYHYVKFEYSYPVEEKIWEENELSVRYQFDWQDSIRFTPMDLTESESLDRLLYSIGLSDGYMEPYYGRPSLVEKGGIDYHLTKYYPNDTVARDGHISDGRKSGLWNYYSYEGENLHRVNYFDSVIVFNDSISYSCKGVYTELDIDGTPLYESYIIEKFERYDCSHSDHYETRQLKTIWEANNSLNRMNGYVINYYDNGTIQSSGTMKDGIPDGEWRFYDPNGKLNKYGFYTLGKRNGRWLSGDLSKTKYLGEICLNPNMPDIEEEIKWRENMLDIEIIYYKLGKSLHREYYDVNMNYHNWDDDDFDDEDFDDEDSEELDEEDLEDGQEED